VTREKRPDVTRDFAPLGFKREMTRIDDMQFYRLQVPQENRGCCLFYVPQERRRNQVRTVTTKFGRLALATSTPFRGYCAIETKIGATRRSFFPEPDRRLGMDVHRGRGRRLAPIHQRAVASDKRLVCVVFGPRSVSAGGLDVEEMCED
jgi:hypothetical protein